MLDASDGTGALVGDGASEHAPPSAAPDFFGRNQVVNRMAMPSQGYFVADVSSTARQQIKTKNRLQRRKNPWVGGQNHLYSSFDKPSNT